MKTPLDMIKFLEDQREEVSTVVLMGAFASSPDLTTFLVEAYPALQILAGTAGEEPDSYLPAYS